MKAGIPFSILLVEDDEDDRMIIDEAFVAIGFNTEVKKFTNGKALFHYLDSIETSLYPSLIVLDNTLPELESTDILSVLKRNIAYQSIPVVVYSTIVSPVKKQQLLSMGAYACYQKGTTMQEIIALAKELKQLSQKNIQEP
ncbi:MAG: response regulator [Flavisolibacter sp.]|nr:response regulator [Flavisolibacter sp.]